jgi:hypothetical protein
MILQKMRDKINTIDKYFQEKADKRKTKNDEKIREYNQQLQILKRSIKNKANRNK